MKKKLEQEFIEELEEIEQLEEETDEIEIEKKFLEKIEKPDEIETEKKVLEKIEKPNEKIEEKKELKNYEYDYNVNLLKDDGKYKILKTDIKPHNLSLLHKLFAYSKMPYTNEVINYSMTGISVRWVMYAIVDILHEQEQIEDKKRKTRLILFSQILNMMKLRKETYFERLLYSHKYITPKKTFYVEKMRGLMLGSMESVYTGLKYLEINRFISTRKDYIPNKSKWIIKVKLAEFGEQVRDLVEQGYVF